MSGMMLWMGHDSIMAGGFTLTAGLIGFVAAHLAAVLGVVLVALLVPRLRNAVRHHRPSLSHVLMMLAGMGVSASALHVMVHGGVS